MTPRVHDHRLTVAGVEGLGVSKLLALKTFMLEN